LTPFYNPTLQFQLNLEGVSDAELGEKMAKYVHSIVSNEYFEKRNVEISKNYKLSTGKQDMRDYMQFLNIDGKQSYVNLDWTPPMIAPKFMEVLIGGFMKRGEKPRCTAVDPISVKRKQYDRDMAEFRMLEPEFNKMLDEATGQYKGNDTFEPESYDELDIFFNVDYRTPEEILMERGASMVMHNNNWNDIKRNVLCHVRDAGYGVTYTRADSDGSIKVECINPIDFFSSYSEKNDLGDASVMGHRKSMKLYELRKQFGMNEEQLFEIAKTSKDLVNPYTFKWKNEYINPGSRPYDDYAIEVLFFEAKTVRPMFWVEKNRENRKYVERKKGRPENVAEDKVVIQKEMEVIYSGVFLPQSKRLLYFKPNSPMIRPSNPKELTRAYFSYSVYMHNNIGMSNTPIAERISSSVRMITLTHMKIQQLIAKMRPSGIAVDISGLKEVNLGQGEVKPLELQKVYDQTGNIYYNSVDEDGERRNLPINELPNIGNINQINSAIQVYNFYVAKIRDEVGINEYREGSSVNPKMGLGVLQSQIRESNNATDFIYDSYLEITEQTITKIGILLHDSVVYGGRAYREFFGNAELANMYFEFKMEMLPDEVEKQYVDQLVNMAVTNNLINFDDAFKIRRLDNVKLQELFLTRAKNKKMNEEMQKAQQNSEMNAQIQERSAQAKMQSDAMIEQEKAKNKIAIEESSSRFRNDENMQKFVHEVLLTSFKEGIPLSGYVKDIVDGYFAEKERQKQMEAEAIAQQQQEAQMEYLAQQGVGPEQIAQMSQQMQAQQQGGGDQAQQEQMMQMMQQQQPQ
jgi:hypothetical protein